MYRCLVTANALSSLLDTRGGIELVAEPYRLQGNVTLCVAYSEYVNYVNSLTSDSAVCLASGTSNVLQCTSDVSQNASEQNTRLYSYYLKDIAFAICKELRFAEAESKSATVILPISHKGGIVPASRILMAKRDPRGIAELDELLEKTHYATRLKLTRSKTLKELAYALVSLARQPRLMSELNLDYDLP